METAMPAKTNRLIKKMPTRMIHFLESKYSRYEMSTASMTATSASIKAKIMMVIGDPGYFAT